MKKLIKTKGTEFEQNGYDMAIIDTNFRAGKPIMLNSADLDMAILNADKDALTSIESEDSMNIYFQEAEPVIKEGLWFKTDKYHYDELDFVDSMPFMGTPEWKKFSSLYRAIKQSYGSGIIGNSLKNYGGKTGSTSGTKAVSHIDLTTGKMSQWYISTSPSVVDGRASTVAVGNKLYTLNTWTGQGTSIASCFDGGTFTSITAPTQIRVGGTCVVIGTDIWIVGGWGRLDEKYNTFLKYSTEDFSSTFINAPYVYTSNTPAVAIGEDIYILCGSKSVKYNITTEETTELAACPVGTGKAFAIDNNIYIFSDTRVIKYSITTNTYEELVLNVPSRPGCDILYHENTKAFYMVGGSKDGNTNAEVLKFTIDQLNPATYTKDTVIIEQNSENKYSTLLLKNKTLSDSGKNALTTYFNDAGYYNVLEEGNNPVEIYYGNGTDWVRIK
jgi:hypothetical protein